MERGVRGAEMDILKHFNNKLLKLIVGIAVVVIGLEYGSKFMGVIDYIIKLLSPFLLGGAMAFVMNVLMTAIEKKFFRSKKTGKRYQYARPFSIVVTILTITGVILVVVFMIVPEIGNTAGELAGSMTGFMKDVEGWMNEASGKYPNMEEWINQLDVDWMKLSENLIHFLRSGIFGLVNSTVDVVGSIITVVVNFLIAFVFAIYILFSKEELSEQGKRVMYSYLKENTADGILRVLRLSNETFSNFLSGQCVEACILGFMFFITMSIMGLPYPLLIGVLVAFTALIPIFGAFIGSIIAAFLIVVINPMDALIFLILFMILQQLEENLIYPHVVGSSVGLPSIWVLVAVTLGGSLMGIIGMLIFIPICSVLYYLVQEDVEKRLQRRNIKNIKWKNQE